MSKDPKDQTPKNDSQNPRNEDKITPIEPVEDLVWDMQFTVVQEHIHDDSGHIYGEKLDDQEQAYVYIKNPDGHELIATPFDKHGELLIQPLFILGKNIFELAGQSYQDLKPQHDYLLNLDSRQAADLWDGPLNPGLNPVFANAVSQSSKLLHQMQLMAGKDRGFIGQSTTWQSNGCTGVPNVNAAVKACCDAHDLCYCVGGTAADRLKCDQAFRDCIRAAGHPVIADVYYAGVRTFGWAFFNYGTPAQGPDEPTTPALPVIDPAKPCTWTVKLLNVQYNGGDIGDDWKYKVLVQDSPAYTKGKHTVSHGGVDSVNEDVASGTSTCNEPNSLKIVVEATEVDAFSDDRGNSSGFLEFVCDGRTYNKSITVNVSEGSSVARMTFNFQIKTSCN